MKYTKLINQLKSNQLVRDIEYDSDNDRVVFHLNTDPDEWDDVSTQPFIHLVEGLGYRIEFNDCEGFYDEGEITLK